MLDALCASGKYALASRFVFFLGINAAFQFTSVVNFQSSFGTDLLHSCNFFISKSCPAGLRGVRYLQEIDAIRSVTLVDLLIEATEAAKVNLNYLQYMKKMLMFVPYRLECCALIHFDRSD